MNSFFKGKPQPKKSDMGVIVIHTPLVIKAVKLSCEEEEML